MTARRHMSSKAKGSYVRQKPNELKGSCVHEVVYHKGQNIGMAKLLTLNLNLLLVCLLLKVLCNTIGVMFKWVVFWCRSLVT